MEEYKYTPEFDVEDCTVPIKNPFEDNSSESSHESQNSQDSIEDGSKMVSSKTPTSTLKRELDKERPVSSCKSWYSQYSQGKNKGVLNFFCRNRTPSCLTFYRLFSRFQSSKYKGNL